MWVSGRPPHFKKWDFDFEWRFVEMDFFDFDIGLCGIVFGENRSNRDLFDEIHLECLDRAEIIDRVVEIAVCR